VLGRQLTSPLVLILIAAAMVSAVVGEVLDAGVIVAIIVLNALLGFAQEWRAERALEALEQMLAPRSRVRRGGVEHDIEARELVPGDVVLLDEGDHVPADLRVLVQHRMRVDESSLTGESDSVSKSSDPVSSDAVLAERTSLLFLGTAVVHGSGEGVVVATGMHTQLGRIADLTSNVESEATPLQKRLARLGRQLGIASVGIAMLVVLVGVLGGREWGEMAMTGIALAVAVIPEGLPAAVTVTLALGVRAMLRRKALVRRLQASETLGSATVICTDKTGTLTENQMTVQRIWLPTSGVVEVEGAGYAPEGRFVRDGHAIEVDDELARLLRGALENNHAELEQVDGEWHALGEPTEAALVVVARKAGLTRDDEHVGEVPFESSRKRMTTVVRRGTNYVVMVKGAPETLIERAITCGGASLDSTKRRELLDVVDEIGRLGLRTLAFAERELDQLPDDLETVERELDLLGIVGIIDPPRAGVTQAIALARRAGIRTLMVTGDAPGTATAIAERIGLSTERVVSGAELDSLDDDALKELLESDVLFARSSPEQKLRIVKALQAGGEVVAMTGDGVNDAPALQRAEIGIAMGQRGTEVARRAADLVLTDDNYASIVRAVEEGRRQYDNIQKFVRYLLSSNVGEVFAIGINVLIGGPLILLPAQILWTNLLTDGVTALALGAEPVEPDAMSRPPRERGEGILTRSALLSVLGLGAFQGAVALWLFHDGLARGLGTDHARTLAFTGLVMVEKINVFNFRALREPIHRIGWTTNPWLLLAWLSMLLLQLAVVYVPFLQNALHTVPLTLDDWGRVFAIAIWVWVVPEAYKALRSANGSRRVPG